MDVTLGEEVGYQTGADTKKSDSTKLLFMVDAILSQLCMQNSTLDGIHGVIIDEAHTRSGPIDNILVMLKRLCLSRKRPDLRIILLSATADLQAFKRYFADCPGGVVVKEYSGRSFPLDRHYLAKPAGMDYVPIAVKTTWKILNGTIGGQAGGNRRKAKAKQTLSGGGSDPITDIIVFVPGKTDMTAVEEQLMALPAPARTFQVFTLQSGMPDQATLDMDKPASAFGVDVKVYIATNYIETGITVDRVEHVVDTGYELCSSYLPELDCGALDKQFITQSAAQQRVGRAGRVAPGHGWHIYTEQEFATFVKFSPPKLFTTDLTPTLVSMLSSFRSFNVLEGEVFPFMMDVPPPRTVALAKQRLQELGVVAASGLTDIGHAVTQLGIMVSPQMGRALLHSRAYGCEVDVAMLAGITGARSLKGFSYLFRDPKKINRAVLRDYASPLGDMITVLNVFEGFCQYQLREAGFEFCIEYDLSFKPLQEAYEGFKALWETWRALSVAIEPELGSTSLEVTSALRPTERWRTLPIVSKASTQEQRHANLVRCLLHGFYMQVAVKDAPQPPPATPLAPSAKTPPAPRKGGANVPALPKKVLPPGYSGLVMDYQVASDAFRPAAPELDFPKGEYLMYLGLMRISNKYVLSYPCNIVDPVWIAEGGASYLFHQLDGVDAPRRQRILGLLDAFRERHESTAP
jgi:pre-mRNA-splicing factor ATP-dependent RNA helicase DHX15/PRP43